MALAQACSHNSLAGGILFRRKYRRKKKRRQTGFGKCIFVPH